MILKKDSLEYIKEIDSNSIDLILTDPPYIISKKTGFKRNSVDKDKSLVNKYKVNTEFGEWDKKEVDWDFLLKEMYRVLKKGGTAIIFYDIWKIGDLKKIAIKKKFKQPRIGTWVKNNPVPINSKINYLTNSIEYFCSFTKVSKPTFNSEYDNGIYRYPICGGKERLKHPNQKPLKLMKEILEKHSNKGDLILDLFGGTGTTAEACEDTKRDYIIIENDDSYFDMINNRLKK